MQQQSPKPSTLPKKVHHPFSENPVFDQKQPLKTLILHHPLKIVHWKNSKTHYFYRLKKWWPSYWPRCGQVVDPEMAKMWPSGPSYWPYSMHIYIYIGISEAMQRVCPPRFELHLTLAFLLTLSGVTHGRSFIYFIEPCTLLRSLQGVVVNYMHVGSSSFISL